MRDAKNITQTPDKRFVSYILLLSSKGVVANFANRPEHSVYKGLVPLPLFC